MIVSIIIKSLNEEKNIKKAIESSLAAIAELESGEVVLADSLSTDRTIEIASEYPIKIVQLTEPDDRSCGIGAELGMQVAEGDYIYILDADMELVSGFLPRAIEMLENDKSLAGVGGQVQEMNLASIEFKERDKRKKARLISGEMDMLTMGGLYKKEAILSIGYFTNRFLNSYEELELGARLKTKGWRLTRLDMVSVKHYGHEINAYKLLIKRVQSGYIYGNGELLRSAFKEPHFYFIIKHLRQIKLYLLYILWGVLLLALLVVVPWAGFNAILFFILFALPFIGMILKKRNVSQGVYSVISAIFNTFGMIFGFFKSTKKNPMEKISYQSIQG